MGRTRTRGAEKAETCGKSERRNWRAVEEDGADRRARAAAGERRRGARSGGRRGGSGRATRSGLAGRWANDAAGPVSGGGGERPQTKRAGPGRDRASCAGRKKEDSGPAEERRKRERERNSAH